ncbi:hypothetical protein BT96DRAFT_886521 [Gymnopus androsaceus JB14]|uniref:Uncharacterized protein n=1 Tax=Gymnopus androsaceus JB14 TaxID=1447944 RepID=A0A6A4H8X8_9AGAR|nr:hypothetical protein BT96DRAFT_886521 [Gymnopus androsaceus JB14]
MKVKPVEIVEQMYCHRYSYPSYRSSQFHERDLAFSLDTVPASIHYAWCSISSWATQLVGNRARRSLGQLIHDPKDLAPDTAHISARLVASTNERTRAKGVKTVTKEDMMSFRIADRACLFKTRSPLVWYLTECMAAPQKKGVLVERKCHNPSIIQVTAISSFILSRNQYANSYMAMHMGIWHIACGSHVDVRHAASHLAMSVHETTARQALATMADTSLENLRTEVGQGQKRYQVLYRFVLDNIQEFLRVWEGGTGLENCLICGTACTTIGLEMAGDLQTRMEHAIL